VKTVNWEWLEKMLARKAGEFRDGEEYISYATSFILEAVERCKVTGADLNLQLSIQWSANNWIRYRSTRDAALNIGNEMDFVDERLRPDEQVMIKLDTEAFFAVLNENQKRVLRMTLEGFSGKEIAEILKRSQGRITQIRDEIRLKAIEFMPEYC